MKHAEEADIRILLFDGTEGEPDKNTLALIDERSVVVVNKQDIVEENSPLFHVKQLADALKISTKTGHGLDEFLAILTTLISDKMSVSRETPSLTRQRHRDALEDCSSSLASALSQSLPELMAEELRHALRKLGRITGRVDVEDLLDVIFKDFCIGK